uniref:Uncharacterized protein n=1 Tax=Opuntia streptacantha TaxID=393608 RepID=A0A7C9EL90_OPUST
MDTTNCNFPVTLYTIPLVSQKMAINWSSLRDVFISDVLIRFAKQNIRGELAAYNWNVGWEVHPNHAQHASSSLFFPKLNSERLRNPKINKLSTLSTSKPGNGRRRPGGSAIY